MRKFIKKVETHFMEVIKIEKTPHSIALGFAIGTFIAIFPTAGLDIPIALLVVLLYPRVNKLSLFGAFLFWNPLFSLPIILLSYKIGDILFANVPVVEYKFVILNQIIDFSRRLFVGLAISAVVISIISYFIVRIIVQIYQGRKRSKKKIKR